MLKKAGCARGEVGPETVWSAAGNPTLEGLMPTVRSCSWCHTPNDIGFEFCSLCGHNAGRPRIECNCDYCQSRFHGPQVDHGLDRDIDDEIQREWDRAHMRDV